MSDRNPPLTIAGHAPLAPIPSGEHAAQFQRIHSSITELRQTVAEFTKEMRVKLGLMHDDMHVPPEPAFVPDDQTRIADRLASAPYVPPPIDQRIHGYNARVDGQPREAPATLGDDGKVQWLAGWDERDAVPASAMEHEAPAVITGALTSEPAGWPYDDAAPVDPPIVREPTPHDGA
jgi:hypothetical protein